jgi:hypothetical protein
MNQNINKAGKNEEAAIRPEFYCCGIILPVW